MRELGPRPRTALVLSGGGARGAYEVGAVKGIIEMLGLKAGDPAPFSVFSGTSVGAINAAFLASRTHRGDLDIDALIALWRSLSTHKHARLNRRGWQQRSLLDMGPLSEVVRSGIDQAHLDANVASSKTHALIVPALHVATGRTVIFVYPSSHCDYHVSRDPRRLTVFERITAEHVLASASIPGIFPPKELHGRLFFDGGLRFNTPLAPTIRAGATHMIVVSPMYDPPPPADCTCLDALGDEPAPDSPTLRFLSGKMLNALLLDPFVHDVQVLERFDNFVTLVHDVLPPEQREAIEAATIAQRGAAYHPIKTEVISPSVDLGQLAIDYLDADRRAHLGRSGFGWLLNQVAGSDETDLSSYMLFDGDFAAILIEAGRKDVHAQREKIEALFASCSESS